MSHLETWHSKAIQYTKEKVTEDLYNYLGSKERITPFDRYLIDRKIYLEQIWVNVWLNHATNHIPRVEKKELLKERDFEVEGVDRKIINHLFRQEIREYKPFDVPRWVKTHFSRDEEDWVELYEEAREQFLVKQEKERIEEARKQLMNELETSIDEILTAEYQMLYIHTRYHVAKELIKYSHVLFDNISNMDDFFKEWTGGVHKSRYKGRSYYENETYGEIFEELIGQDAMHRIPELLLGRLNKDLITRYEKILGKPLRSANIRDFLYNELYEIASDFIEIIREESVSDLLSLAEIPFDERSHELILQRDIAERERREAEEIAERKRKQEEEARRIEDIFGQEYQPGLGRNIKYVLHIGETNTGKTHHALEKMKKAPSGLYLAPLRLLALEVYDKLNTDGIPCTLKTGEEEKISPGAEHYSCTVEMFHEKDYFDVVVIDESQMIADKDRGFSWYKAIMKANAREVHIVGSRNLKEMMLQLLGEANMEIREYSRDIPLQVEKKPFKLEQTKKGDALVCFSRKRVLETASRLQNQGHKVSMIYGSMPPETRKKEMLRFIEGDTNVIVSTDAIGMGLNLPIRRIVFLETEKFDGIRRRRLNSQEVKQIAGRAGRKGIYDVGKVAFTNDIKIMKHLLEQVDTPVHTFAIAPTNAVFERFQKYYRELGSFFELWDKFESPQGTEKASLSQEKELYEIIMGTEIEARLSMMELYGFLHLPFSTKDYGLVQQWRDTMFAIVHGEELPEPVIKRRNLEQQELSYKAIGLHLLFLYRLDKRLEATYWERVREELSDAVHESLKTEVKKMTKKCRNCGKPLPWEHHFQICDACHFTRYQRR